MITCVVNRVASDCALGCSFANDFAPPLSPGYVAHPVCENRVQGSISCSIPPSCATGYHGTASATCEANNGQLILTGCSPNTCIATSTPVDGYNLPTCEGLTTASISCSVLPTCAARYHGTPSEADVTCAAEGAELSLAGCEPDTCVSSTTAQEGYTLPVCESLTVGSISCSVPPSCAAGYHGTATVECTSHGSSLLFSGCEINVCTAIAAIGGYTTPTCDLSSYTGGSLDLLTDCSVFPSCAAGHYLDNVLVHPDEQFRITIDDSPHLYGLGIDCPTDGGNFSFSGCAPCTSQAGCTTDAANCLDRQGYKSKLGCTVAADGYHLMDDDGEPSIVVPGERASSWCFEIFASTDCSGDANVIRADVDDDRDEDACIGGSLAGGYAGQISIDSDEVEIDLYADMEDCQGVSTPLGICTVETLTGGGEVAETLTLPGYGCHPGDDSAWVASVDTGRRRTQDDYPSCTGAVCDDARMDISARDPSTEVVACCEGGTIITSLDINTMQTIFRCSDPQSCGEGESINLEDDEGDSVNLEMRSSWMSSGVPQGSLTTEANCLHPDGASATPSPGHCFCPMLNIDEQDFGATAGGCRRVWTAVNPAQSTNVRGARIENRVKTEFSTIPADPHNEWSVGTCQPHSNMIDLAQFPVSCTGSEFVETEWGHDMVHTGCATLDLEYSVKVEDCDLSPDRVPPPIYDWQASAFSQCEQTCGLRADSTRDVKCVGTTFQGFTFDAEVGQCQEADKPSTTQTCAPVLEGGSCDDGIAKTMNDVCNADGVCQGKVQLKAEASLPINLSDLSQGALNTIGGTEEELNASPLAASVKSSLATSLDVAEDSITIKSIVAGSVVIDYRIALPIEESDAAREASVAAASGVGVEITIPAAASATGSAEVVMAEVSPLVSYAWVEGSPVCSDTCGLAHQTGQIVPITCWVDDVAFVSPPDVCYDSTNSNFNQASKPCCWASWDGFCDREHPDRETCEADGEGGESGVWCADVAAEYNPCVEVLGAKPDVCAQTVARTGSVRAIS